MSLGSVQRMISTRMPTSLGDFELRLYQSPDDDKEHLALIKGDAGGAERVMVRIHSECFTGDVFGSARCDCGDQLRQSIEMIQAEGCGVILYLRQEGRGIGLLEKLRAYNLQDLGYDTVSANEMLGHVADGRDYSVAAWILNDLDIRSVRLLTNNPTKVEGIEELGIEVVERLPVISPVTAENADYLLTKVQRMQHHLDLAGLVEAAERLRTTEPARAFRSYEVAVTRAREQSAAIGEMLLQAVAEDHSASPFVTLSYAQSIDGCIAAEPGQPLALSGRESLELTHRLRAAHDAILVGIGTVLSDDPRLTVRLPDAEEGKLDPQAVILDGNLRTPDTARLLSGAQAPWIFTSEGADRQAQKALEDRGARVIRVASNDGKLVLEDVLRELEAAGIDSLMVEGGGAVITSFLEGRLADQLILTVAPKMIGGFRAVRGPRLEFPRLRNPRYQQMGDDLIVWSELDREAPVTPVVAAP